MFRQGLQKKYYQEVQSLFGCLPKGEKGVKQHGGMVATWEGGPEWIGGKMRHGRVMTVRKVSRAQM